MLTRCTVVNILQLISLSKGDGNENDEKTVGLDWQNTNFEPPNFTFCGGREHKTITLFFFFWTLIQSYRIQLQKNSPTFDEQNEMEYLRFKFEAARTHFLTDVFIGVAVAIQRRLRNVQGNSILMTRYYPDPCSASDQGG